MARQLRSSAWSSGPRKVLVLLAALTAFAAFVVGGLAEAGLAFGKSGPPAPTIAPSSLPASPNASGSANFSYSDSPVAGSSFTRFLCALDASSPGAFSACGTTLPGSSKAYAALAAGPHSFRVEAVYGATTSAAASFSWTVLAPTTLSTRLSARTTTVGTPVSDRAFLFSDPDPDGDGDNDAGASGDWPRAGGSVSYTLYTNDSCSAGGQAEGTVTLQNGTVPSSGTFVPASPGTWYWQAAYSGDGSYAAATSACASEPLTVTRRPPLLSTSASGPVTIGQPISDTATLIGASGIPAVSTVSFNVYVSSGRGSGGDGDNDSDDHVGCGTPLNATPLPSVSSSSGANPSYRSASFTPTRPGTYSWVASFAGDANNGAVAGACGAAGELGRDEGATDARDECDELGHGRRRDHRQCDARRARRPQWERRRPLRVVRERSLQRPAALRVRLHGSERQRGRQLGGLHREDAGAHRRLLGRGLHGDADNAPVVEGCGAPGETSIVNASAQPYTISGSVTSPLLWPTNAATGTPIDVAFANPNGDSVRVSSLVLSIASVTAPHATAAQPCTTADFAVTQFTGTYPFFIPPGPSSLGPPTGAGVQSLGFASGAWPSRCAS